MINAPRATILVVDDDNDTCQNLADILRDLDYDVATASGGTVALELARTIAFDVALLDLKMPGMDGLTLHRSLRKLRPGTVAIIVTAYASESTTREALLAGAWHVLSKPVDFSMLLPLVNDVAGRPRVLIVDDDESLCDSLCDILREEELRVCTAHTEQEARGFLEAQDYEVILVDLKLPGGDSHNVLSDLQERHLESRTVLMTGHPREYEHIISSALEHGTETVCYKPFDLRMLLATIERLTCRTALTSAP